MIDETENNYNDEKQENGIREDDNNIDQQGITAKDITAGTFNENQIKQANKEFNNIIIGTKNNSGLFDNKTFKSFYHAAKNISIEFDNLKDKQVGYTENRKITLNTSIFYKMKNAFIKLSNKIELTNDDIVFINFFTHEYLHTLEEYSYPAISPFARDLSEGLREITAWKLTDSFLRGFYKKDSRSFFDIMYIDSPTYKDITYILKPIFDDFKYKKYKDKNIFEMVDEKLAKNSHDDIFEDFGYVLTKLSNKKISDNIIQELYTKIDKAIKERKKKSK
jgi:hypothetical protein